MSAYGAALLQGKTDRNRLNCAKNCRVILEILHQIGLVNGVCDLQWCGVLRKPFCIILAWTNYVLVVMTVCMACRGHCRYQHGLSSAPGPNEFNWTEQAPVVESGTSKQVVNMTATFRLVAMFSWSHERTHKDKQCILTQILLTTCEFQF